MLLCSGKAFQTGFLVFVLSSVVVMFAGRSALSARPDGLEASTLGGAGTIIQSLLIRDHVSTPMSSQDRMFKRRRAQSGELEERADESSGFAWELGYAFSWPAVSGTSAGTMRAHSGHVGMDLEINPSWAVSAAIRGDIIPDQSYGHGYLGVRLEAFVPLFSIPRESAPEPAGNEAPLMRLDEERDARAYYFKHRKQRLEVPEDLRYRGRYRKKSSSENSAPLVETRAQLTNSPYPRYDDDEEPPSPPPKAPPPEPLYPHLNIAFSLSFDQHVRDLGTSLSLTSPLSSGDDLSQVSVGGEFAYLIHEGMKFYVSGRVSSYSGEISAFLTGLPTAPAASFIMPSSIVAAFQPHFLAFPGLLFEEGATFEINERWTLGLALNQVFYASTGAGVGLGFAPAATYLVSHHWRLGMGGGVGIGGPGSGTVLGLLNLSYLFL